MSWLNSSLQVNMAEAGAAYTTLIFYNSCVLNGHADPLYAFTDVGHRLYFPFLLSLFDCYVLFLYSFASVFSFS